eukprot:s831_g8.t1
MVGVSKLCKALEGNTSLWSLPLEGNEAEDEVITGVEALAADVAGRRERQPPKPRFAFSEPLPTEDAEDAVSETNSEASSPASSASQVSSPSRPVQPAAMPMPRPEEPTSSTKVKEESAEDMVQLVDNFVQRFLQPEREASELEDGVGRRRQGGAESAVQPGTAYEVGSHLRGLPSASAKSELQSGGHRPSTAQRH